MEVQKNFNLDSSKVEEQRQKYGSNRLTEKKQDGFWKKYFEAFNDPIIKILMVALVINLIFVFTGNAEWYEAVGIFVAVLLATFVSTFSEYSNEKTFAKLQAEADQIKCKVNRDNKIQEIPIDDIVVGDYVILQAGDKIPADGVMVQGEIKVDQSSLNGESEEATKRTPTSEMEYSNEDDLLGIDRVFRGTTVTEGECIIKICRVGDNTTLGKLAQEIQEDNDRETPLKVKLTKLAKQISRFGYIGAILIAVAYMFMQIHMAGYVDYFSTWQQPVADLVDAIILAVIIIVMAVPEGLPLMIALVSGLNMRKMLNNNVLVKKINGIETAGSLNILFSDKTGTITKGKLEVVEFLSGKEESYKTFDEIPTGIRNLLKDGIIENSSAVLEENNGEFTIIGGNGTERALLGFLKNSKENSFKKDNIVIEEQIPFNSKNKYSATTIRYKDQPKGEGYITLIKGAPEKILNKCTHYFSTNGRKSKLNSTGELELAISERAKKSMRMLAFAISDNKINNGEIELDNMTLVGFVAIRDEVRPEAVEAIKEVNSAGIQVVMITGDIKDTAVAIAKDAGIITNDNDVVLTSSELQELNDNELKAIIPNLKVVARALPSDKSRLVKLAQELNLVVGMTGDGVNDSPALKKADVGFAMGSGTEVAKEAGDIVILDDNFKSIDKAVLFGRTIYNNIRMFIMFQLTINVSAVLISFFAPLFNLPTPLTIIQILWVNLIMDTLAALAFGGIAPLKRYMQEKPKSRTESIVSKNMMSSILTNGIFITIVGLLFLMAPFMKDLFRPSETNAYLLTGYFTTYIFMCVFNGLSVRTSKVNIFENITHNPSFLKVFGIILLVQIVITYLGGDILRMYGLTGKEWLVVLITSILIIPLDMIRKFIVKKLSKNKKESN